MATRKWGAGLILFLILLVGIIVTGRRFAPWSAFRGGSARQAVGGTAGPSLLGEEEVPPLPNIALQINRSHKLTVAQGAPWILSVRLANLRAINVSAQNSADESYLERLQAAVARGEIQRERVGAAIARLQKKRPIRVVRLGDAGTGWERFVRLSLQVPGGRRSPLPWPIKLASSSKAGSVTLDEKTTAELDYTLSPEAAGQVAPGEYRVVAALEVPAEAKLPADRWRGRVESEPVELGIAAKAELMTKPEEEKLNLEFADYFAFLGDLDQALTYSLRALAANATSIAAHTLVAETRERKGDLAGALSEYRAAEHEFYQQYPKSYEPPGYLIEKSGMLMQRLGRDKR